MKLSPSHDYDTDLLVVGGGVLGSFYAYHAIQRGLRVTLVERHGRPHGATVRNFGQIVPSGLNQDWQRYGRDSLQIYREIQSHCDLTVRQNGSIYIASNDEECTLIEELHQLNAESGYTSELWSPHQCFSRYPNLRLDYCKGGLFFPNELSINPRCMINRLHQYLGTFPRFRMQFHTLIRNLTSVDSGGIVAETSAGQSLHAQFAIVCCGSEIQMLFPERFRRSEMQLCKLQLLRLRPQPSVKLPGNILTGRSIRRYESFSQCPSWEEIKRNEVKTREADDALARWGIHILFKQELDGGIILGDSHVYAPASAPDELDYEVNTEINNCMLEEARRIMDFPEWDTEASWCGVYSQTSDPRGIYSESPAANLHITTGIGGKGMTSSAGFTKHHLEEIYPA